MQLQLQLKLSSMKPNLDLCPPASRLGKTFWCQCGECVVQGSKTGTRLFWLCRVCGESSLSVEGLHVDLQLSRSTCQCFQASDDPHSVTCSWTALTGFLDMTKRPLKCLTQQPWVEIFCFSPLALLSSIDGSFSHHCLYLFYTLSLLKSQSARAATQQTSLKFLVPRKPMKANAILSVLVDLAAAESATEDRFQRRRPTRLTLSCTLSARSSRVWKALELSGQ